MEEQRHQRGHCTPLELYVISGNINSLAAGVYHYRPSGHSLEQIAEGDKRKLLSAAAMMQGAVNKSAAVIVIAAEYKRTTGKYLERGKRYVHMEAGHAAQNILPASGFIENRNSGNRCFF